jgi:hypothetical protein
MCAHDYFMTGPKALHVPEGYKLCSASDSLPEGRCQLSEVDDALPDDDQEAIILAHAKLRLHGGRAPVGNDDIGAQVVNLNQA